MKLTVSQARQMPLRTLAAIENAAMWHAVGNDMLAEAWRGRADAMMRDAELDKRARECAGKTTRASEQTVMKILQSLSRPHTVSDICQRFGMARTTVYYALHSLQMRGMVTASYERKMQVWERAQ